MEVKVELTVGTMKVTLGESVLSGGDWTDASDKDVIVEAAMDWFDLSLARLDTLTAEARERLASQREDFARAVREAA